MSISSNRRIINEFTGDVTLTAINAAGENDSAPGQISSPSLVSGNNTITPPFDSEGVTIVMPNNNTILVTLKGVNGDTGIALHLTDPTSLGLNSTSTFVLNCANDLTGVLLIWS